MSMPFLLFTSSGCRPENAPIPVVTDMVSSPPRLLFSTEDIGVSSPIRFVTVTNKSGVDFTYYGGPSAERYMTEQNGGGVGLLDFDGDGQLDIFFSNGSHFKRPAEQNSAPHQLYIATGDMVYSEVAAKAGLAEFGFGMGCAVGDFDNDGFADLFLAQYGTNRLWRNNGDGTFLEVTESAGLTDNRWGTSAAFADLDGDGNLDLYVVNYVEWSENASPCYTQHPTPIKISCGPIGRTGQPDLLYRSAGDGTFLDHSESSGIIQPESKGLGLAIADFDADGLLDIYVANDTTENFLFQNQGGMRFAEVGVERGVAVGDEGLARSGMGVACGDINNDGRFDLLVTNFDNEVNDLYKNLGDTGFVSINRAFGLNPISRPMLGFGAVLSDFDLDGHVDAFVANGHVWDLTRLGLSYAYEMRPQLIRNLSGSRFADVSIAAGIYFQSKRLGRGVACGDLDGDGDADLVVTHLETPADLLRNSTARQGKGCRLRVVGTTSARYPLGCRVDVTIKEQRRTYWIPSGGSFQSASDTQLVITCGQAIVIDEVTVHWPGQALETWRDVDQESLVTLLQGTGGMQ